jgi:hypothetical protein
MIYKELPRTIPSHPLYWLEEMITNHTPWEDNSSVEHNKEHAAMQKSWGLQEDSNLIYDPEATEIVGNRCYHILLHLKYWKEEGIRLDIVKRYEDMNLTKLEDIPVPNGNIKVSGESY